MRTELGEWGRADDTRGKYWRWASVEVRHQVRQEPANIRHWSTSFCNSIMIEMIRELSNPQAVVDDNKIRGMVIQTKKEVQ